MSSSQQLNRSLNLKLVIVFVIANVIGSGVYKKVAPMMGELHSSGWVLIAWVLGGIISLFGALSYAEVAGLLASTGGDYVYYQKIYNKFFAFQFGWSTFAIIQTVMRRLEKRFGRAVLEDVNRSMKLIRHDSKGYFLDVEEIAELERPPMLEVAEYRSLFQSKAVKDDQQVPQY